MKLKFGFFWIRAESVPLFSSVKVAAEFVLKDGKLLIFVIIIIVFFIITL